MEVIDSKDSQETDERFEAFRKSGRCFIIITPYGALTKSIAILVEKMTGIIQYVERYGTVWKAADTIDGEEIYILLYVKKEGSEA